MLTEVSLVYVAHSFILSFIHYSFISLGLPDVASKEASSWVEPDNDRTVLIDASTAFRVDPDWTYGFPGKSMMKRGWIKTLVCESLCFTDNTLLTVP